MLCGGVVVVLLLSALLFEFRKFVVSSSGGKLLDKTMKPFRVLEFMSLKELVKLRERPQSLAQAGQILLVVSAGRLDSKSQLGVSGVRFLFVGVFHEVRAQPGRERPCPRCAAGVGRSGPSFLP